MLLWTVKGGIFDRWMLVDLPCDVALEASDDLLLGEPVVILRSMEWRVRGSETILVMTMCQSAALAWRSPLRLSRCRSCFPLPASIGLLPQT